MGQSACIFVLKSAGTTVSVHLLGHFGVGIL